MNKLLSVILAVALYASIIMIGRSAPQAVSTLSGSSAALTAPAASGIAAANPTAITDELLAQLGISRTYLSERNIIIVEHEGAIEKNCRSHDGSATAAGLAIKGDALYAACPDGTPIIPVHFQNPGKCTVHYSIAGYSLGKTETGNSQAILAHELGHCLAFGAPASLNHEYYRLRQSAAFDALSIHDRNEIFADDFMLCRYGADTNWGADSYYQRLGISRPSKELCTRLNALYDLYFYN